MTTLARELRGSAPPDQAPCFRARWILSRQAVIPTHRIAATPGPDPTLEWTITPSSAHAVLIDHERATEVFRTRPGDTLSIERLDALTHVRVEREGAALVVLVMPSDPGECAAPLYARTTLLAALGLRGGRYELERPRRGGGPRP